MSKLMEKVPGYGDWTLKQLKAELKTRGGRQVGKKQALVERLESYDRNANFGNEHITEQYSMVLPDASLYRDVNSDSHVPNIEEKTVKTYLQLYEQDLQNKPKEMYYAKFLRSLRIAHKTTDSFLSGRVSAEMKKHVVYRVDIKIDKHNIVVEAQCECGAGMGPDAHCKHVSLVLFAISKIDEGVITMETCTQLLQTFHQVKKYDGSPVMMQNLRLRQAGTLSSITNWEPRPDHLINNEAYPNMFRNIWLNSSGNNLPVRQLYAPANIYAVCHDHDYLEKTPEANFLEHLMITSIDRDSCASIELKTRGQGNNKYWLHERALRLHASNYHRIIHVTHRTDIDKLAKTYTEVKGELKTEPIKHGRKYEDVAIKDYEKCCGATVIKSGIIVSQATPYLGCSPDGLLNSDGIIEVKCPFAAKSRTVNETSVPYIYKKGDGTFGLRENHEYYTQVMGTLMCTERSWCDFVVWTFKGFEVIRIKRDDTFIENLKTKLAEFYEGHFERALLNKYLYRNTFEYMFD